MRHRIRNKEIETKYVMGPAEMVDELRKTAEKLNAPGPYELSITLEGKKYSTLFLTITEEDLVRAHVRLRRMVGAKQFDESPEDSLNIELRPEVKENET